MNRDHLDPSIVSETLGCILKYQEDIRRFKEEIWSDPEKQAAFLD